MREIGIMETAARARVAASADCNRLRASLSRPRRSICHGPRQSSYSPSLSPELSKTSASTTFVDLLVMTGFCKRHSPRGTSLRSAATRASSTAAAIVTTPVSVQDAARTTVHMPPHLSGPRNDEKKYYNENEEAGRRRAQFEHPPIPLSVEPDRTPPREVASSHSDRRKMPNFGGGSRIKRDNLRTLFKFYTEILGYEEAAKSLDVVTSNPEHQGNLPPPRNKDRSVGDDFTKPGVARLVWLLSDKHSANESIFYAYKDIPSPGVSHLSEESRSLLLSRLSVPPRLRRDYAVRYLTVIDDMCNASLYISPYCWNTAIHLAGKCGRRISEHNVSRALDVWSRMEIEGKIRSCSGVFNTLFDIAIKAGQFRVADKLMEEMKRRGTDFSRFGRVARIYYRGLQRDEGGVRQAYREFVRDGEVVDTVVLNCVLVSLIRCGRFDLAQQMYERMADVHLSLSKNRADGKRSTHFYPEPFENYAAYRKASKKLGNLLGLATILHRELPKSHSALQAALPLTPDGKTFHIFLTYHAFESGDLERFLTVLRDMEVQFSIPPQGMVYILLFQGFAIHGKKPKTAWTLKRLHGVWETFLRAVDNSDAVIRQRTIQRRTAELKWENPLTPNSSITGNWDNENAKSAGGVGDEDGNEYDEEDDADDEWGYQNTVYLGGKMIVSALDAFYICGGRQAVLELWPEIQYRWRRKRQTPSEIARVKRVLDRLLD